MAIHYRVKVTFFALVLVFGVTFIVQTELGPLRYSKTLMSRSLLSFRNSVSNTITMTHTSKLVDAYPNKERWIILDYNPPDIHLIENLATALPDWLILAVTDSNTTCRLTNCLTLRSKDQAEWMLEKDSNSQNARICFAIAHGARMIYLTDRSTSHQDILQLHLDSKPISILELMNSPLFNHYSHFGQPGMYAHGFPVNLPASSSSSSSSSSYRILEQWRPPVIQHVTHLEWDKYSLNPNRSLLDSHINHHRQQQQDNQQQNNIENPLLIGDSHQIFNPSSPPVLISPGTLSTFNSKNTLFAYKSLWSLLQPRTSRPEFSEAWQSLYAQRLLWEIDEAVGFYPPSSKRTDSVTISKTRKMYLQQFDVYKKRTSLTQTRDSTRLVPFLKAWDCPESQTFNQCMITLSMDLTSSGFWTKDDVILTISWVHFLETHGYKIPVRVIGRGRGGNKVNVDKRLSGRFSEKYYSDRNHYTRVRYSASQAMKRSIDMYNVTAHRNEIQNMCTPGLTKFNKQSLQLAYKNDNGDPTGNKLKQLFSDILVIIVFNSPYYENVKHLLTAFGPIYTNVVICGENWEQFQKQTKNIPHPVTFIQFNTHRGYFGYQCATKAMQMGYRVKGYFVTGDDVVLFFWNFIHLDKNKIWMPPIRRLDPHIKKQWYWWNTKWGARAYNKTIRNLTTTTRRNYNDTTITSHETFLQNLFNNSRGTGVGIVVSDTWYIPERYKTDAIYYLSKFYEERLFLEIAVPVFFWGIEKLQNIHTYGCTNLWDADREDTPRKRWYHQVYNNSTILTFHPVKLSKREDKAFFCNTYLVDLLKWIS